MKVAIMGDEAAELSDRTSLRVDDGHDVVRAISADGRFLALLSKDGPGEVFDFTSRKNAQLGVHSEPQRSTRKVIAAPTSF
jgi:hypothetical protein